MPAPFPPALVTLTGATVPLVVRGERFEVESFAAHCTTCGTDVFVPSVWDAALQRAYARYRARHEWLSPEALQALRQAAGYTVEEFADALGVPADQVQAIEAGRLQDAAYDAAVRRVVGLHPEEPAGPRQGGMMMEPIVAIEMRDDAGRYCSTCGTQAVARYYGEPLANATEAASALEEAGDGGGLVSGYTYDVPIDPTTAEHTNSLSVGRVPPDRCMTCGHVIPGGVPRPQWDGLFLDHYELGGPYAPDDGRVVVWSPSR